MLPGRTRRRLVAGGGLDTTSSDVKVACGFGIGGRGRIRVIGSGSGSGARIRGGSEDALSLTGIMTVNSGICDKPGAPLEEEYTGGIAVEGL